MAQVTIVITDMTDGSTNLRVEFDPPLVRDQMPTSAQAIGHELLTAIGQEMSPNLGKAFGRFTAPYQLDPEDFDLHGEDSDGV